MKRPGEFDLIAQYFAPLAGEGSFGLKDDAALLKPQPGNELVITQDAVAEGIHFFADDPPDLIARKALRVNLSDLAAKGARPASYSLALGLGESWNEQWIADFANGLAQDQKEFRISLCGGDTFRTGASFVISITAIGECPSGRYVSRLGAQQGDMVYVTGTIGDGALGLLARQGKLKASKKRFRNYLKERYLLPQPRSSIAETLRNNASAAMDISDGLVGDLEKLARVSGVGAKVNAARIPFSTAASAAIEAESKYLQNALTGGDDYEILAIIPASNAQAFERDAASLSFPVTCIGEITGGEHVQLFDRDGNLMEFQSKSYNHSES